MIRKEVLRNKMSCLKLALLQVGGEINYRTVLATLCPKIYIHFFWAAANSRAFFSRLAISSAQQISI
jgi:hypothetical protein